MSEPNDTEVQIDLIDYAIGPGGFSVPLNLSGIIAALLATALPLAQGVAGGWGFARTAAYSGVGIIYVGMVIAYLTWGGAASAAYRYIGGYLLAAGLLVCALLALSGDRYIQPLAFTVPFVIAVISLPPLRAAAVGALYLGLMALGLRVGVGPDPGAMLVSPAVYGVVMLFMYAAVRIAFEHAAARREATALASALAHERDALAALAAENARLAAKNAAAATLAERNRIARELHDTIAQGLTAVTMQIEAAQRAADRDPERMRARLGRAHVLARETLADVRRSVWALAAPEIPGDDLGAALAEQARRFAERTGLAASYRHSGPPLDLPGERAIQALRIVQEALQNIEKHAGAASVEVGSCSEGGGVQVWVSDDGRGFDPAAPPAGGGGFGLVSLRERARLAGGALEVDSAPGAGARVALHIPGAAPREV
ncbi:sensor histidine kinase [Oscillochloris sp. ZM17-4]|uniref:sensor histidine kinase n=1 Tax=Oscillochloris sp. ZM17-4 TaxID=2866714 RepID=UPI001C73D3DB|nr:sensor histidine kinase [Oscillochloris sp. ZM17-4]MBX0326395.1 sensor histidine kinase [Oscillochloris sp. ZM17-4]